MRSFLKWPGGKYYIKNEVIQLLPKADTLVEPFIGSGVIFLNSNYKSYLLNDINPDLINLFKSLKYNGEKFILDCKELFKPKYNKETKYYSLRDKFNTTNDSYEKSIIFLYLNRHGYNGLCRYNKSFVFNVPFGRYKKPYFPEDEMHFFHIKSKLAVFTCENFINILARVTDNSVVYADPPYVPLTATAKFTSYFAKEFGQEQQLQLVEHATRLKEQGVPVLLSNHDTRFTRKAYNQARIIKIQVPRFISCKHRSKAKELLALFS